MKTHCLGYTHEKCDTCQHEKNWQTLNQMPDALRKQMQSQAKKADDVLSDEALWAVIAAGMITPAHIAQPTVAEQNQINAEVAIHSIYGAQPAPSVPDVDALAQFIREIDGAHQLGAGVLAERIVEWLAAPEAKP